MRKNDPIYPLPSGADGYQTVYFYELLSKAKESFAPLSSP